MTTSTLPRPSRPLLHGAAVAVAALGHLSLGVLYAGSALLAPAWAVVSLWVVWLALLALLVHWRRRPLHALLVPVAGLGIVLGTVSFGERVLGWAG